LLTVPLYFGIILRPERTAGQIVINKSEGYLLGQSKQAALTTVTPMKKNQGNLLGYCGVRASDLTMSFLFCKPEKELEPELLSVVSCRVLLLDNPADPVVWRGPVIAGAVKQFWSDVAWGDVDVMFVDMPPGTGDVPLTVLQSLPVAGVVIVTSPQDLVSLIVEKAVRMADMMKVPVLGIVENMCEFKCPDCGKVHRIFGEGKVKEIASARGIKAIASIPIDEQYAKAVDLGAIESVDPSAVNAVLDAIV
jgi:hypothetical protein